MEPLNKNMKVEIYKIKDKLYTTGYYHYKYSELMEALSKHYDFQFIINNGVVLKSDEKEYAFMVPYVTVDICRGYEGFSDEHDYAVFYRDFTIVNKIIAKELKEILNNPKIRVKYIKAEYYLDYFKYDHLGLRFDKRVLAKTLEIKLSEEIFKSYMVYE